MLDDSVVGVVGVLVSAVGKEVVDSVLVEDVFSVLIDVTVDWVEDGVVSVLVGVVSVVLAVVISFV